jgi:hypothetical protein
MEMKRILAEIDAEINKLQRVRAVLVGSKSGRHAKSAIGPAAAKRQLSPEARARIAAAQRARWAKAKKQAK